MSKNNLKRNSLISYRFSLIEILVVIGIISILAGLLMPAVSSIKKRGKTVRAKLEANSIASAILAYSNEYMLMPWSGAGDTEWDDVVYSVAGADVKNGTPKNSNDLRDYDILCQILTKTEITNLFDNTTRKGTNATARNFFGGNPMTDNKANPKNIQFLDTPAKFASEGFRDPWGNCYIVCMDLNYDNQVTIGGTTYTGKVFVYSMGDPNDDKSIAAKNSESPTVYDDDGMEKVDGTDFNDVASWK